MKKQPLTIVGLLLLLFTLANFSALSLGMLTGVAKAVTVNQPPTTTITSAVDGDQHPVQNGGTTS